MSTTLSMGRMPAATRRVCIHAGDGPMRTPVSSAAAKRRQARWASIPTSRSFGALGSRRCHTRLRIARPEVDRCEQQLVGVGVLPELLDARGPDPVVPPRPLDALHLGAGHMELERQLVNADVDLDVLAQP